MRTRWVLILTLVCGVLAGCAPPAPRVVLEKDVSLKDNPGLVQVFQRYWAFRVKENVNEAFALEAPYVQEMVAPGRYRNYLRLYGKGRLKEVQIYALHAETAYSICLDCRGVYQPEGKKEETRDFQDCWVKVNETWYHVLKNPLLFPRLGSDGSKFYNVNPQTFCSPLTFHSPLTLT